MYYMTYHPSPKKSFLYYFVIYFLDNVHPILSSVMAVVVSIYNIYLLLLDYIKYQNIQEVV